MKFDLLFLCHEKDKEILKKSIEYAKKNVVEYRKIFVVSKENYFPNRKDITFIDEKKYPFSKKDIEKYAPKNRVGWYYQQFLKLYFFEVAEKEVLDNLLIIDADTMFIRKTKFFEKEIPLYNVDECYHEPYYKILEKLFGFGQQNKKYSGTTHHMLFQKKYINEIFNLAKEEFWIYIMKNIDPKLRSGLSEQELYFNYMLKYHPEKIKIRKLKFIDFPSTSKNWIKIFKILGYSYIASHDYLQEEKFPKIKSFFIEVLKSLKIKGKLKRIYNKFGFEGFR